MKRRILMIVLALVGLTSAVQFFAPAQAQAFPGFARKYNFPCTFCHIAWPKLSDQGNYFHDRGFMLSTTGRGNGLDMMAFQPTNQNYWPIAWRTTVGYTGSFVNGVAGSANGSNANGGFAGTGATANIDFLSGGLLNSYTSWWLVPTLAPGATAGGVPSFQFESAWVRFDNIFNTSWLNLKVGKSAIDIPFSVHRGLQLIDPYVAYDYVPGVPWISNTTTGGMGVLPGDAYYDADGFSLGTHHYNLQYFGYQFENGCGSQAGFSIDPCETRLTVSLLVNDDPYAQNTNFAGQAINGAGGVTNAENGFSYWAHLTQSFGGWGATNGERIGAFALVGWQAPISGAGVGYSNPQTVFNREGFDLAANPIPNGGLNIYGMFEVAQDPTGLIFPDTAVCSSCGVATQGVEYMTGCRVHDMVSGSRLDADIWRHLQDRRNRVEHDLVPVQSAQYAGFHPN